MRVFLDTNVLVSGFATRGLCADVVRLVLAEHELIVGEVVIEELQRILRQKIELPSDQIQEILAFLENQTVQSRPKSASSIPVRDHDDQWVLASALAAEADVLVTGDKDLLDVAQGVAGLIITDPRGFWNLVKKRPTR
ncbi:MAG TPA: putative toxin-antitoxin system toxin component, PIN family [Nitrospira sp.]|nr:putative toxin-antitoxin system toxin component, PIN family [Nitrospira sp.]